MQPIEILKHLSMGLTIVTAVVTLVTCVEVQVHIHGNILKKAHENHKRKKLEAKKHRVMMEYEKLFDPEKK